MSRPAGAAVISKPRSATSACVLAQLRMLGECEFGFGVNRVRQLDQVAATPSDGVLDGRRRGGAGMLAVSHRASGSRARTHRRTRLPPRDWCAIGSAADSRAAAARDSPTAPASTASTWPWSSARAGRPRRRNWASPRPSSPWPSCPASPRPARRATAARCCRCASATQRVLVLLGRIHAYEGHDLRHVVHPVRTACAAGARTVVLTNAAGGLRADIPVGQPVLISDHLNLTARSPLVGAQFVDLVDAYSPRLRDLARAGRPDAGRGRLRRAARPALRDARRDPDAAHAGRGPGGHVDGARDDRGARGRRGGARASPW